MTVHDRCKLSKERDGILAADLNIRRTEPVVVKFLTSERSPADLWLRQFPGGIPDWGGCRFIFDVHAESYDWLVVYNDLPANHAEELLACPPPHTILVTTEPPSIKSYGIAFTKQFGSVLTSQPGWALPHEGRIFSQPALHWFYGVGSRFRTYDQMIAAPPLEKSRPIATVCSSKKQKHTLHNRRYRFTQELKQMLPELDIYGHGVRKIDDKAESLDPYRYHIAIENFLGEHHWTEKLADAFLGVTLPFYFGCPNAEEYFPPESFIRIDINDVAGSYGIIRRAIDTGEFEKRLPYILEARRRVMEEYNLFAVLSRLIGAGTGDGAVVVPGSRLLSRHMLRRTSPLIAFQDVIGKCRLRIFNLCRFRQ